MISNCRALKERAPLSLLYEGIITTTQRLQLPAHVFRRVSANSWKRKSVRSIFAPTQMSAQHANFVRDSGRAVRKKPRKAAATGAGDCSVSVLCLKFLIAYLLILPQRWKARYDLWSCCSGRKDSSGNEKKNLKKQVKLSLALFCEPL